MEEIFDVAIIGTGPAGLSAAITLKIRNKKIILFGSKNLSEKIVKAHEIQNYPGFPSIKGSDLAQKLQAHIDNLGIEITEDLITTCYSMGSSFSLTSKSNKMYSARSVILATGVNFGKPFEGEEKFLGRGVSYCATCDAPFYKGKKVFVTGHTGFKGSWLCKILANLGAEVTGYSLNPPTEPSLFAVANIEGDIKSVIGDIRDYKSLKETFDEAKPEVVLHLAAQPIVRDGYKNPAYTYETNLIRNKLWYCSSFFNF